MASILKKIILATAITAAGASNAAAASWDFVSGTVNLVLSYEGILATEAAGAMIITDGAGNKAQYDGLDTIALELTGGTAVNGEVKTLTSQGASFAIERQVLKRRVLILDRTITLSNFVLDLDAKSLLANVTGTDLLTGVSTDYGFGSVYSFTGLSGAMIGAPLSALSDGRIGGTVNGQTFGKLSMTSTMAENYLTIFGLPLIGALADLTNKSNWGNITVHAVFATIPEPGTCLSFVAGLAVLGAARARRQRTA